jgi:hypothetical protein
VTSAATSRLPIRIPAGAREVTAEGPGPFVTAVGYVRPDGRRVSWTARAHRRAASPGHLHGLTWWTGLLFAIGSACFVVGPIGAYAEAVGARGDALTFFVGSLFFTVAAYLTFVQVVRGEGHAWFGWMPDSLGFWAAAIQLVGTLYFNVTTFAGLLDVPADLDNRIVWRPDAIGSVCFLVASGGGPGGPVSATGTSRHSTCGVRSSSGSRPSAPTTTRLARSRTSSSPMGGRSWVRSASSSPPSS